MITQRGSGGANVVSGDVEIDAEVPLRYLVPGRPTRSELELEPGAKPDAVAGLDELEGQIRLDEVGLARGRSSLGDRIQPVGEACDLAGQKARIRGVPRASIVRRCDADVEPVGVVPVALDGRELVTEECELEAMPVAAGENHARIVGASRER